MQASKSVLLRHYCEALLSVSSVLSPDYSRLSDLTYVRCMWYANGPVTQSLIVVLELRDTAFRSPCKSLAGAIHGLSGCEPLTKFLTRSALVG